MSQVIDKTKETRRERARRIRRNFAGGVRIGWEASPKAIYAILAMNAFAALMPVASVKLGATLAEILRVDFAAGKPFTVALPVVAALGAVAAAQRVIGIIQATRQDLFRQRVVLEVQSKFLRQAATVDLGHFDNSDWHDRVAKAKRDMDWRPAELVQSIVGLLGAVITTAGMIVLLISVHWVLVFLALLSVIPSLTLQKRVTRKLWEFHTANTPEERERDYISELVSLPKNSKEIRAFNLADYLLGRRSFLAEKLFKKRSDLYLQANRAYSWSGLIAGAALTLAYGFFAYKGFQGELNPGQLIVVIGAFASLTGQIGLISGSLVSIDQHSTFLDDYFSFLKIETLVPSPPGPLALANTITAPHIKEHGIELSGIHFQYPGGNEPALSGLNLHIRGGEMLALVGDNGAGKTSLVKLLLRFYDPQAGSIRVGGVDIRDLDPTILREKIGILFQDYATYELSVRENVMLGRAGSNGHDEEAVLLALERARSEWLVKKLGKGLDSKVGRLFEGGHDLSGGEWQRLALARLIYRDADIWILDEPTSSLDPEAEAGIFAELRENLQGRIGLVISHRFSTVRIADRIAVVEDGRISELGTHEELMAAGGRYAYLFDIQAAGYR